MTDSVPETDDPVGWKIQTEPTRRFGVLAGSPPKKKSKPLKLTVATDELRWPWSNRPRMKARRCDDPLAPGAVSIDPTGKARRLLAARFQRCASRGSWLFEFENGSTIPLVLESGADSCWHLLKRAPVRSGRPMAPSLP